MTDNPLSCKNLSLLCLNNHIVRTVNVNNKVYNNKFKLSIRWLNCALASNAISSDGEL